MSLTQVTPTVSTGLALSAYSSHAAFMAATVPAPALRVSFTVGSHTFSVLRDAAGPITQTNGQRWRPDGAASPQHFGMTDGGDAGPSTTLALRYLLGENNEDGPKNGHLHFPSAVYRFETAAVVGTFQTTANERFLKISGAGAGTILEGRNATGVIGITSNARRWRIEISDMHISPELSGSGYAISIIGNEGGSQGARGISMQNVTLTNQFQSTGTGWWNAPLVITGWNRVKLRNVVHFNVPNAAVTTKPYAIFNLDGCYKVDVGGCYANGTAERGITNVRTGEQEGGHIVGNTINGADVGFWREQPNRGPEFWFVDNHVNAVVKGLYLNRAKYVFIRGNLMYSRSESTDDFVYFDLVRCNDFTIESNGYRSGNGAQTDPPGTATARHIVLEDCRDGYINETALAARAFVPPFLIKSDCARITLKVPFATTNPPGSDSESYPSQLIEVEPGAETIIVEAGEQRVSDRAEIDHIVRRYGSSTGGTTIHRFRAFAGDDNGTQKQFVDIRSIIDRSVGGDERARVDFFMRASGEMINHFRILPGTAANESSAVLAVFNGTTYTLQRVKVGSNDSGGAGSRVLIIDNA